MDKPTLPRFFKDEDGFCYIATPLLAAQPHLTPHDGDVDERGFAVEGGSASPKGKGKRTAAKAAQKDPFDDALGKTLAEGAGE